MAQLIATSKTGLWSHSVPNQSPALIVTSVLFLLITTVFFGLRINARRKLIRPEKECKDNISRKGRKLDLTYDSMAAAAYFTLVVQTIFGGLAAHYGFGKHRVDILPTFSTAMHFFFLYQICYKLLGGFTKLTFCFLYLRLVVAVAGTTSYQRHFITMVVTTAVVTGAGTFAFTVATVYQCTPIERAWDQRIPGHCTDNLSFWYSHAAFNTLMDIIVFLLPLPIIGGLVKSRRTRIGVFSTFALGAFVIAASIARMIHLKGSASSTADPTWGSMPALIWTEIEANTAVIVCCCPALRLFVTDMWRKARLFVGQTVSNIDSHKLPSNQNSAPSRPAPAHPAPGDEQPPRISRTRSGIASRSAALWEYLKSLWRKLTSKPEPSKTNNPHHMPYTAGNLTYAHAGHDNRPRRPWFSGWRKQHNDHVTADEENAISHPSARIRFGRLFKPKKKDVEGTILQHQDVMLSTHRRSMLEQIDGDFEMEQFIRQETEREGYQDRKFEREAGGRR